MNLVHPSGTPSSNHSLSSLVKNLVPGRGLEPPHLAEHAPKACASTISPPRHEEAIHDIIRI
jgi:hypothetical protein